LIALVAACDGPPTPAPPAATTSSTAAPTPPKLCTAEHARCSSDTELQRCRSDGSAWESSICAQDTTCIDDHCVSLALPDGERLERGQLLRPRGDGFINAWAVDGMLRKRAAERLVSPPANAFASEHHKRRRARCSADGFIQVEKGYWGKRKDDSYYLLSTWLISSQDRRATLKIGAQGHVRVWLGDALVADFDHQSRSRPLVDEQLVEVQLRAGVQPLLLSIGQTGRTPTGVLLRLHNHSGVRFALPSSLRCAPGALVSTKVERTPTVGGFDMAVALQLDGLAPEAGTLDWSLNVGRGKRAATLAEGKLSIETLAQGSRVAAQAAFDKPRNTELVLKLGRHERSWPLRHRGELHDRVVALKQMDLPPSLAEDSRTSFSHAVATMVDAVATGHHDGRWIQKRTTTLEQLAKTITSGEDPYRDNKGVVYRAYRSELDGQPQPYVAYIPPSHDHDGAPMPLVVVFHGLGQQPALALRTLIGAAPKENEDRGWATRHLPPFPDLGAILVAPWGYGSAGQRHLGEHDVLRVIEEMKQHYNVDDTRVSLTGYSLGGTVAFVVPLHYPDQFSAAAPLCGYPNLTTWQSIRNTPKQPFEELMIAKRFIGNYAVNGIHLPLHIVHGGLDGPQRSAVMAKRYEQLGYRHVFDLQDTLDHNVWEHGYENGRMIAWLRRWQRPTAPDRVRLITGEYRYHRAFWIELIAMTDPNQLASIDAQVDRDAAKLEVTTKNVAAFKVLRQTLAAERLDEVIVDGTSIEPTAGDLVFARADTGMALVPAPPSRAGHKRPGVSGPLDDVLRHRVLIVYGGSDPAQRQSNALVAKHFSSHDSWAAARFPIKRDDEVTDADIDGQSIVLIGNAKSNRVTEALLDQLPLAFEPDALIFRGQRYAGPSVGVSFIHPHPRAAGEYVVVHAGVDYPGTLAARHLPRLAPDYLVYDHRIRRLRGGELLAEREVLAGGFFGDDWN